MNQYEKGLRAFLDEKDWETRSLFRQMRGDAAQTIFGKDYFSGGQLNTRLYCEPKLVLKAQAGDFGDMDEDDLRERFSDLAPDAVESIVAGASASNVHRSVGTIVHEEEASGDEHIEEQQVSGIYCLSANPFSDSEYQKTVDKGLLLFLGIVDYLKFNGESIVVGERKTSRPPNDPAWASDVAQALGYCWSLRELLSGSAYADIPMSVGIDYTLYLQHCRLPVVDNQVMGDFGFTLGWWKSLTPYQVTAREMSRLYRVLTMQSKPLPPASNGKCNGLDGEPCEYRDLPCPYRV